MKKYVFKICTLQEWNEFKEKKFFKGSQLDLNSGFIHLCSLEQLKETIDIYYSKEQSIVIVKFMADLMRKNLKWEKSRSNNLFPHFFGDLNLRYVLKYFFINMHKKNKHLFSVKS